GERRCPYCTFPCPPGRLTAPVRERTRSATASSRNANSPEVGTQRPCRALTSLRACRGSRRSGQLGGFAMPQYLSPGVYVEEVEAGSRPIEGVGTAVAAFVGLAERG